MQKISPLLWLNDDAEETRPSLTQRTCTSPTMTLTETHKYQLHCDWPSY